MYCLFLFFFAAGVLYQPITVFKKKHLLVKSDTYYLIEYEVFFDLFLTRTCTFIEIHVLSNILRVFLYDELVEGGYFLQNIIAYKPLYAVKDSIPLKCST